MGLSHRASVGSRGLAVVFSAIGVLAVGLPVAWSRVTADDPSSGPGAYPAAYAITGAKIVAGPGKTFDPGTIVVRRGVIEAVGLAKDVTVPYDAETIEGKGLVVYPGFIDLYTTIGQRAGVERSATGKGRPVDLAEAPLTSTPPDNRKGLTPEFEVATALELTDAMAEPRRRLGFTDLLSAPSGAIATGQSALVSLSGLPRREAIISAPVALHVHVSPPTEPAAAASPAQPTPGQVPGPGRRRGFGAQEGAGENPYPRVLMGSVAHFRQAMLDAEHQQKLTAYYEAHGGAQPPFDPALKALQAARSKKLPVWWEANTRDEIHRALDLAEEFGTTAVIVGGLEAAKVADRLKAAKVPVVLRLNFAEEPKIPSEAEYRKKAATERDDPLRTLAHKNAKWKEQVSTAAALSKAGVSFAFATEGVEQLTTFPTAIRQLITAGLTADAALAALTQHAAVIAGVDKRLGTIEAGKLDHLIAMTGPFNESSAKVRYVLIDGLKFEIKPEDRARTKSRAGGPDGPGGGRGGFGRDSADSQDDMDEPAAPKSKRSTDRPKPVEKPDALVKKDAPKKPDVPAKPASPVVAESKPVAAKPPIAKAEAPKAAPAPPFVDIASEFDEDRKPTIHTGGDVLIKGATILTVTRGTIAKGSILIEHGKIKAVGSGVTAPVGVKVIDATGLVAMPGIIDTHSHIAVQGGVNEGTLVGGSGGPCQRRCDRRRRRDLPGDRRWDDHGPAAPRLRQHDRRPARGRQAALRTGRAGHDHQGRSLWREVRPR